MFDAALNGVMAQVDAGKIVLPAMQRPFVWKEDRITKLSGQPASGLPPGNGAALEDGYDATVPSFSKRRAA